MPKEREEQFWLQVPEPLKGKLNLEKMVEVSDSQIQAIRQKAQEISRLQPSCNTLDDYYYAKSAMNGKNESPSPLVARLIETQDTKTKILQYGNEASLELTVFEDREPDKYFADFLRLFKVHLSRDASSTDQYRIRIRRSSDCSFYFSIKHKYKKKADKRSREYDFKVSSLEEAQKFVDKLGLVPDEKRNKKKIQEKYSYKNGEHQYSIEFNKVFFSENGEFQYLGYFMEIELRSLTSKNHPAEEDIRHVVNLLGISNVFERNREHRGYTTLIGIVRLSSAEAIPN